MLKLVRRILAFITAFSILPFAAKPAFAVNLCPEGTEFNSLCGLNLTTFEGAIPNAITIILILAVIIAVIFLLIGGIKWIISGGDKSKVESARGTIVAAIIGLVVALLAFLIINVVLNIFNVTGNGNFDFPNLLPE